MNAKKGLQIVLVVGALLMLVTAMVNAAPSTKATSRTNSDVLWWWGEPAGSSTLMRSDSRIWGTIKASLANEAADTDGLTLTLWLVVFNEPSACATSPCSESDLFNADVKADVLYGSGGVVGNSEQTRYVFHRREGDSTGSIASLFDMPTNAGEPWGVIDAKKAEIHYVLRSHGPENPATMPEQIETFEGGCVFNAPVGHPFPTSPADLQLGAGDCQDIQYSIHQAQ